MIYGLRVDKWFRLTPYNSPGARDSNRGAAEKFWF